MRLAVPRVLGKACSKRMVIGKRAPRRRSKKSALSCSASASASQQVWEYKEQGGQFGGTNPALRRRLGRGAPGGSARGLLWAGLEAEFEGKPESDQVVRLPESDVMMLRGFGALPGQASPPRGKHKIQLYSMGTPSLDAVLVVVGFWL